MRTWKANRLRLSILVWIGWLVASNVFAADSESPPVWVNKIRQDHPRLFFNADTWPAVRARALGEERAWYDEIRRRVDSTIPLLASEEQPKPQDLGVRAAEAAFVFLVTEDRRYRDLAVNCLETSLDFYEQCFREKRTVNWYATSRVHATLAWDWLYNDLAAEQRREIMSRLVAVIDNVITIRPSIYRENMSGYSTGFYGVKNCLWFIGCTAWGTGIHPETVNRWLVWGHDENRKLLAHRKQACGDDGGGASPTLGYVLGAYPWAEQNFFYTWLSATGENIAPDWPHGAWLANYVIWNWIPADPDPLQFGYGDTPHVDNRLPIAQLYTHMANIRHLYSQAAPEAAALAHHVQTLLPHRSYSRSWFVYPFLLSEPVDSADGLPLASLPHARHFEQMGQICMRSGTGLRDTYCLFTCGGILSQHRHFDALNFVIYHRGFLALDSGTRYDEFTNGQHLANYFSQTVAHNCVLIHQPGEPPARYWGGTVKENYGGQHRQLGSIVRAFETNDDFTYVAGDATACYQHGAAVNEQGENLPEKCSLATRQLVFLMPNHFVICDRITTTDAAYRTQWLVHTAREPAVDGGIIRADHGDGRLFCRTLLPRVATVKAVGGPGQEFLSAGKNWEVDAPRLTSEQWDMMGRWRVEVSPNEPGRDTVFLHLLQVGPQSLEEMDRAEVIDDSQYCGVRLTTASCQWEVAFSRSGDLGGSIQCEGNGRSYRRPLATTVLPQSGILHGE
jgi:hypothetical protein